jgi:hypothetical protein
MADERRIVTGSYVIPQESAAAEESIDEKWSI